VRRVLDVVNPELLVLVETELWPNLIHAAHRRGTRVAVVNGRLSPRSFPRYRLVRRLLAPVLAEVDALLMQAPPHAERALAIGAPAERVRVSGNLKYDGLGDGRARPEIARLLGAGRDVLWVCGSTVEGEETSVLEAFGAVRRTHPRARLLIAPRHPERFDAIPALVEVAGFRCARRTLLGSDGWGDGDVLVLDTIGELASVYALADVVFVGGSLAPRGGHNVLEAAVAGKPIVVGPHMENFQEIADEFVGEGALVRIGAAGDLAGAILGLLADPERRARLGERARAIVERNRGAVDRTLEALCGLLA
jgi:3-deoxy-D-manno-octulosonic-acid transferase